jgi:hypothetical protein
MFIPCDRNVVENASLLRTCTAKSESTEILADANFPPSMMKNTGEHASTALCYQVTPFEY